MRLLLIIFPLFLYSASVNDISILSNKNLIELKLIVSGHVDSDFLQEDLDSSVLLTFKNMTIDKSRSISGMDLVPNIEISQNGNDVVIYLTKHNGQDGYIVSAEYLDDILKIVVRNNPLDSAHRPLENAIRDIKSNVGIEYINSPTPFELEPWRYISVILVLLILLMALFIIKRKIKSNQYRSHIVNQNPSFIKDISGVSVDNIVHIDDKNRIVIIKGMSGYYLIFIGEHNSFVLDSTHCCTTDDNGLNNSAFNIKSGALSSIFKDRYSE